jgi:hypothetical protein
MQQVRNRARVMLGISPAYWRIRLASCAVSCKIGWLSFMPPATRVTRCYK